MVRRAIGPLLNEKEIPGSQFVVRNIIGSAILVLSLLTLSGCRFIDQQMSSAFPTQAPGFLATPGPLPAAPAVPTSDSQVSHANLDEIARLVTEGINRARTQASLAALRPDATLTRMATARSTDLINRDYFSHYDPETGKEPLLGLLQSNKYAYQIAGENLAEIKNGAGWVPPFLTIAARYSATELADEFVQGWLKSPEHRANILNSRYRRTGVGISVSVDGRRFVATQVFSD